MDTDFNLQRFVDAQQGIYEQALAELRAGHKRSHWMWFIFPQVQGLGSSETARRYAIKNSDEAAAYLAHPILGPRLRACAAAVAAFDDRGADEIFDYPDNLKFHSSMTLFADVAPDEAVFQSCLDQFFDGQPDQATLDKL